MVNNLVSALGKPEAELVRGFMTRYDTEVAKYPEVVNTLVKKGIAYYNDRILPNKKYREPTDAEKGLFADLKKVLSAPGAFEMSEKELQSLVFDIARERDVEPKDLFAAIYQVLLGQDRGPRFGTFARLVGVQRVIELIDERGL